MFASSRPGFAAPMEGWAGLPSLLEDVQVAFELQKSCGQSFWLGAGAKPRCGLEALAAAVFELHLGERERAAAVGVEWWVQVRGRGSKDGEAIGFHWDRDEVLADGVPQRLVHPTVATVTYLSSTGAPTVVVDCPPLAVPPPRQRTSATAARAFVSHPAVGKHIAFDGPLLHGVPPELALSQSKRRRKGKGGRGGEGSSLRYTFLANVWTEHRLVGIEPLPDAALGRLKLRPADVAAVLRPRSEPEALQTVQGAGPSLGFVFGRPGDEEHELWMPRPSGGGPGSSSIVAFGSQPARVVRKPVSAAAAASRAQASRAAPRDEDEAGPAAQRAPKRPASSMFATCSGWTVHSA